MRFKRVIIAIGDGSVWDVPHGRTPHDYGDGDHAEQIVHQNGSRSNSDINNWVIRDINTRIQIILLFRIS